MTAETKHCSKCKELKSIENFHRDRNKKDGHSYFCKLCVNMISRNWYKDNKERRRQLNKKYREENRERLIEYDKMRNKRDREKHNEYQRNKYNEDLDYRLKMNCRKMVRRTLQEKPKTGKTIELLGYTHRELEKRIECQFQPGMSWANHGEWHIDHKISIQYFLDKGEYRVHIINALSNLQPMWASENCSKG